MINFTDLLKSPIKKRQETAQQVLDRLDWDIIEIVKDGQLTTKKVLYKGDGKEQVYTTVVSNIDNKITNIDNQILELQEDTDSKIAELEAEKQSLINLTK